MGGSKGFPVILDLSRHFQDHRRIARIFIRTDFKTLQDLQVHISKVFGIYDYYLTSGEHYLPVLEDIGILSSEETICVIPNQETLDSNVSSSLCSNNRVCTEKPPNITFRSVHEKSKADTVRLSRQVDTPLKSYKKYRPPQMITGDYLKKKSNNVIRIDVLKKNNSIEPSNVFKNEQDEDSSKSYVRMAINSLGKNNSLENVSIDALPEGREQNNFEKKALSNNDICEKKDTSKIKVLESAKNEIAMDASSNVSLISNKSTSLNVFIESNKTFPFSASSPFVDMGKRVRISEESSYTYNDIPIETTPNDKIQESLKKTVFLNNDIDDKQDTLKMSISESVTNNIGLDVSSDVSPIVNNSDAMLNSVAGSDEIFPFSLPPSVQMGKQILEESSCYFFDNKSSINATPESKIHNSLEKIDLSNTNFYKKDDRSKINSLIATKNVIAFDGSSDIALTENDNDFTSDASLATSNKRKRIRIRKRKKPKEPVLESREEEAPFNSLFKTKSTSDCSNSSIHIRFEADKIDSMEIEANKDNYHAVDSKILNDKDINNKWEHHISEAPLMNTIPKTGDVMAFKILKIGENYTPQISNNVIGKVVTYQPETKEISMNILGGLEELSSPSGKFGLDWEENGEKQSSNFEESTTRSFLFTELIVPRLLQL